MLCIIEDWRKTNWFAGICFYIFYIFLYKNFDWWCLLVNHLSDAISTKKLCSSLLLPEMARCFLVYTFYKSWKGIVNPLFSRVKMDDLPLRQPRLITAHLQSMGILLLTSITTELSHRQEDRFFCVCLSFPREDSWEFLHWDYNFLFESWFFLTNYYYLYLSCTILSPQGRVWATLHR